MAAFPKIPFLSVLLLIMILYGMEYPFGHFALAVLVVSPPNFLRTPNLLAGGELEKEIVLTLCKHFSTIAKTLVCYQHHFSHKFKT